MTRRSATAALGLLALAVFDRPAPCRAEGPRHLTPADVVRRHGMVASLSPDGHRALVARIGPFSRPGTRLFLEGPGDAAGRGR